ncbi:hypothetical protein [Methylorubrum extorquens]|uniref:hypothetical protein n=1 Tax=Methylorubrum extorquens TaxID=408 RepID=UPI00130184E7|nr:hypothetical protein [Methylorubrum extorquens]
MFEASNFLAQKWATVSSKQISTAAPLSYVDEAQLAGMLVNDGRSCLYSALVSVADALRGLDQGFYSWSGVKLYYAAFYASRASLAFSKTAIFYIGTSAYWIDVRPGALPSKPPSGVGSSSHKLVLKLFENKETGAAILSQPIDGDEPLVWLQKVREELNYRNAKFVEPFCPSYFRHIPTQTTRRLVAAYFDDKIFEFSFDPEHALVAYPIELLKFVAANRAPKNCFGDADKASLGEMISDRLGRLAYFDKIMNA